MFKNWDSCFACDVFLLLSRRHVPKEEFKSNEKCQLHVVTAIINWQLSTVGIIG